MDYVLISAFTLIICTSQYFMLNLMVLIIISRYRHFMCLENYNFLSSTFDFCHRIEKFQQQI